MLLLVAARFGIGFVFLSAGGSKLLHMRRFRGVVGAYTLVPAAALPFLAVLLPPAEIAVGAGLIAGIDVVILASSALFLFVVFLVATAATLRHEPMMGCGCGGVFSDAGTVSWTTVARNLAGALICATLAVAPPPSLSVLLERGPSAASSDAAAGAVAAGLFLSLIYVLPACMRAARLARRVSALLEARTQ
jgi:hypothetical protein